METFLRIVELTVPSIIVFVAVYFMVKKFFNDDYKKRFEENENLVKAFFENEEKKRAEAYKIENAKITVPLRIYAFWLRRKAYQLSRFLFLARYQSLA